MTLLDGGGQLFNFQVCLVLTACAWFFTVSKGHPEAVQQHYLLPGMKELADNGLYLQFVPQDPPTQTVTITMAASHNDSSIEYKISNKTNFRLPLGTSRLDMKPTVNVAFDEVVPITLSAEGSVYIVQNRGDTLALLSNSKLGKDYIILTDTTNGNTSTFIYGTQDATLIHVYKRNYSVNESDDSYNITEIAVENYEVSAQSSIVLSPSFSGDTVQISADKPVAVLTISESRGISKNETDSDSDTKNNDFTWEMLTPSTAWGKRFLLVTPSVTDEIFLKIAGSNDVNVNVSTSNGTQNYHVLVFSVLHLNITGSTFCVITSAHAVEVLVIASIMSFDGGFYRNVFTLPPMENSSVCQRIEVNDCFYHECLLIATENFASVEFSDEICDYYMSNSSFQVEDINYSVSKYSNLSTGIYRIYSADQSNLFIAFRLDRTKGSFYPAGLSQTYLPEQTTTDTGNNVTEQDSNTNGCYDTVDESDDDNEHSTNKCSTESNVNVKPKVNPNPWGFSDSDDDEKAFNEYRVAVIVSLCAAIFAVVALILAFLLLELLKRRKQLRNTKIRPFVS